MQLVGQRVMYDLRKQLFAHLQRLQMSFFDRNPVGRLVTRVTTDVDVLNDLFASGVVAIFGDIFSLLQIVVVMLKMDWKLALLTFSVLPVIVLVTAAFRKAVRESYRRIRVAIARINAYLQEHITGMAVLQLFNREERSFQEFEKINRTHMEAYKDSILAYGLFFPAVDLLGTIAVAHHPLSGRRHGAARPGYVGTAIAFIQYSQRFFRPIQDLSDKYNLLQAAMASSERIFKLLDTPVTIADPSVVRGPSSVVAPKQAMRRFFASLPERSEWAQNDTSTGTDHGHVTTQAGPQAADHGQLATDDGQARPLVEFRQVGFAYTGRPPRAGKCLVLGRTRVRPWRWWATPGQARRRLPICCFVSTTCRKGRCCLTAWTSANCGCEICDSNFGIVLQDPFLFSGTIASNIRLGSEWITDRQIREAARQVSLLEFIESLPGGFEEPVKERGATLSVGQKQLLSFARALAHNPRILILDEATSSVDPETEHLLREGLRCFIENRTSLVIAHRLSTIQNASKIVVMHKGRVREVGTHQELLQKQGIYFKLYQLQYKDQEITLARGT